ncbi:MAG: zf-HC2 domain-containing protein [Candidatus Krumholzibacteriota bacterium]|nr:zf-HC2 domain-containing protein [Candidatus Krumholzibacteriota bacterium]
MKCHLFKMLIQKYYDGELDPAGNAEYENHAVECKECGKLDREYSAVLAALDGIELFEPSEQFNRNVMLHVDVARYKVGAARKAWISVRSGWNRLPTPLRVTGAIAAVFGLFVAVYTPILATFAFAMRKIIGIGASGIYLIRRAIEDPAIITHYLNSLQEYRVAGRLLVKTLQRQTEGISAGYLIIGILATVLSLYLIIRMTRMAWRKGETHVGII